MTTKTITGAAVKAGDRGEFSAVFATFGVIDRDGDVITPAAIKAGAEVVVSAYGHQSWQGLLPVGKGTLRTSSTEAIVDGQFFMDTTSGRETFAVVKALGPLQEWSFSLENVTSRPGELGGIPANFIESVDVKEVSPVLVGAGIDTRTLATKQAADPSVEAARQYLRHVANKWRTQ